MNKKVKETLPATLFFITGIIYGINTFISKDLIYIPLSCCFIALGVVFSIKAKNDYKDKK